MGMKTKRFSVEINERSEKHDAQTKSHFVFTGPISPDLNPTNLISSHQIISGHTSTFFVTKTGFFHSN